MLPVNPATTIWFGLLQSLTGIAGLIAGSGFWRIVCGVLLLRADDNARFDNLSRPSHVIGP